MGNKTRTKEKISKNGNDIYRDIVVTTNTLIWRTDVEGLFTFLNPAWEKTCGFTKEEMLGRPFSEFQVPEAAEYYTNEFRNCLIGESIIGHETVFYAKNGEEISLAINMIPLYDSDGHVTGTQGTAFDISERMRADELLQYISAKDELTGLYNLHTFLSMTGQQKKTGSRDNKEVLVIYAGVDGMKAINEEHGQQKGDLVLTDVAKVLRRTFREADIIARTSGDEFAVSTLVSSKNTEAMIMSRLKANLDKYNADKTGSLRLSISFGTSFCNPDHPVTISEMLSAADAKMHEDKISKKS